MNDRMFQNMMQSMGMGMGMGMGMPMPFDEMFADPFSQQHNQQSNHMMNPMSSLMPHSFMSPMSMMMMNPFGNMQQMMSMASNGNPNNSVSFCSSSVTSYTSYEHGRPQVFQQSHQVNTGPDGVKETKSSLRDTRTGRQEMSIGHHIYDKAHIKKKSKNTFNNEEEVEEEYVNLEEEEADQFEQDWTRKARSAAQNNYHSIASSTNKPERLAIGSKEDSKLKSICPSILGKALKKDRKKKNSPTHSKK